jgi:hypothetical protein
VLNQFDRALERWTPRRLHPWGPHSIDHPQHRAPILCIGISPSGAVCAAGVLLLALVLGLGTPSQPSLASRPS